MVGYGLSLGGGGSRGAYQVGVWKALKEQNIKIDYVVGTSIGAINGAFICQNSYEELNNLWLTSTLKECFHICEDIKNEYSISLDDFHVLAKTFALDKGLNPSPLRELLIKNIDEAYIRESSIGFGLVTICITTFQALELFIEDIPSNKLIDYIMASASMPGFKKLNIDGESFLDGGMYSNVPSEMLLEKKFNHIIEVDIHGPGIKRKIKDKSKIDFIEITPQENLGSILNFHPDIIKRNMNLGYLDGLRAFNSIGGHFYYFSNEELTKNKLLQRASNHEAEILLNSIGYNDSLFDKITFFRSLKCLKDNVRHIVTNTDKSVLMAMEITAEALNIKRDKIYTYDELLNIIIETTNLKEPSLISNKKIKNYYKSLNCNLMDFSSKAKLFRKTLAITLPKDFIAHMFLSFIKYRLYL